MLGCHPHGTRSRHQARNKLMFTGMAQGLRHRLATRANPLDTRLIDGGVAVGKGRTHSRGLFISLLMLTWSVMLGLAPAQAAAPVPSPTPSTGVQGDDGRDIYIGSGGLVFPAHHWQGDPSGRRQVLECTDCQWRITTACTSLQFDTGSCPASHVGCPSGLIRVRVWLKHGGGPWVLTGYACIGGSPPPSRSSIERAVRDLSIQVLPALRPSYEPASGALTGLPVDFWSGQSRLGLQQADLSVLGVQVMLDARPRWKWFWGDGGSLSTIDPGGRYPRMTVTHTYLHNGRQTVRVLSRWRASYTVEGLGPYPVPGVELSQSAVVRVDVRPAHSVLTG